MRQEWRRTDQEQQSPVNHLNKRIPNRRVTEAATMLQIPQGLYCQTSFSTPLAPTQSYPIPPNSQKFPDASVHPVPSARAPVTLLSEANPSDPYIPICPFTSDPPIQVHSPPLYSHKSLSQPLFPAES